MRILAEGMILMYNRESSHRELLIVIAGGIIGILVSILLVLINIGIG